VVVAVVVEVEVVGAVAVPMAAVVLVTQQQLMKPCYLSGAPSLLSPPPSWTLVSWFWMGRAFVHASLRVQSCFGWWTPPSVRVCSHSQVAHPMILPAHSHSCLCD
jgi:hypothetical protein